MPRTVPPRTTFAPACGDESTSSLRGGGGLETFVTPRRYNGPGRRQRDRAHYHRPLMQFGGLFRERRFYESPAAIKAYRALRGGAAKVGLHVVLKTFYSPIPELDALPEDVFGRRASMAGIDFDLDKQLDFLRDRAGAMAEFQPPAYANGTPGQFYTQNPSYSVLDATVLYGILRSFRPSRVVELGSGHSTLVTAQAARAN